MINQQELLPGIEAAIEMTHGDILDAIKNKKLSKNSNSNFGLNLVRALIINKNKKPISKAILILNEAKNIKIGKIIEKENSFILPINRNKITFDFVLNDLSKIIETARPNITEKIKIKKELKLFTHRVIVEHIHDHFDSIAPLKQKLENLKKKKTKKEQGLKTNMSLVNNQISSDDSRRKGFQDMKSKLKNRIKILLEKEDDLTPNERILLSKYEDVKNKIKNYEEKTYTNYPGLELEALIVITDLLHKNNDEKIPYNCSEFMRAIGYDPQDKKLLTQFNQAIQKILTKPFNHIHLEINKEKGTMEFFEDDKPALQITTGKRVNIKTEDPNEVISTTKYIEYYNKFYQRDCKKFYTYFDRDIFLKIKAYRERKDDSFRDFIILLLKGYVYNVVRKKTFKIKINIYDVMSRIGKEHLLTQDLKSFTSRKEKSKQRKFIKSGLDFMKKENYIIKYEEDSKDPSIIHIEFNSDKNHISYLLNKSKKTNIPAFQKS